MLRPVAELIGRGAEPAEGGGLTLNGGPYGLSAQQPFDQLCVCLAQVILPVEADDPADQREHLKGGKE